MNNNNKYAKENLTSEQKTIRSIICDLRNDLIGSIENAYMDYSEKTFEKWYPHRELTKKWAIETIYKQLVGGKSKYVVSPLRNIAIERKHIKFLGKDWIMGLIEDRVEYDFYKNGWGFPHNYLG